uniref:Uncharacterized protein n=1 Tax=Caenorhabditis tropicalis TaxID=1561998 RepID=A0A1I7U0A4_9PELO
MIRYILLLFIVVFALNDINCSIIDNKTTDPVEGGASNKTIIRAERNNFDPKMVYLPGPYRIDYPPSLTGNASQSIYTLWNPCPNSTCSMGNSGSIVPFIAAAVFIILAFVIYIILFCFVFRYMT